MEGVDLSYQTSNFLEISVISELRQKIEQIDSRCNGQIGEDVVNERIRQLAYSKLLTQVYGKDMSYLIKAYTDLGVSYLDIKFCQQSREHLLTALKLNDTKSAEEGNETAKEIQIKILINLAEGYLEEDKINQRKDKGEEKDRKRQEEEENERYRKIDTAIQIADKCLVINQKLYGPDHISNAEIYKLLAKGNKKLGKYKEARQCYQNMFDLYKPIYGLNSEIIAKLYTKIGKTFYFENKDINDAIDNFMKAFEIYEQIIKNNRYDELFKLAEMMSDLYSEVENFNKAYEILDSTDEKYSALDDRDQKAKIAFQKKKCFACNKIKNPEKLLAESIKLEVKIISFIFRVF
ncbi:MAG: tetratricopeptide repeat protein [archaeon]|nr:tetratricopeptide repeat protein [archaeon]